MPGSGRADRHSRLPAASPSHTFRTGTQVQSRLPRPVSSIDLLRARHIEAREIVLELRQSPSTNVQVRSVDEIAASLAEGTVYFPCLVLGRTPTSVITEGHRAERCLRNSQSAVAQKSIFHMNLLFSYVRMNP
jgi:hypothetical protein